MDLTAGTKPIKRIRIGDKVATRDPATGKAEFKRVVSTKIRTAQTLLMLALADKATGKVIETITATPEHPFNVSGKGLTAAINLAVGNAIVTRAGPTLIVQSITPQVHPEGVPVYNFEVEDDHTYFVGTANGGTWVHNDCGLKPIGNGVWESPGGLRFGPMNQGHRLTHVMEHLQANLAKPVHSVFDVKSLISILDEGWANRGVGVLQSNGNRVFDVGMGRAIGTAGKIVFVSLLRMARAILSLPSLSTNNLCQNAVLVPSIRLRLQYQTFRVEDKVELSLIFEDNGIGHNDLILRFAGQLYACDTYYLALDLMLLPGRTDNDKIRMVLQKLLEQWLSAVENVPDGGKVYLPYDFSDQYTGWLCCFRSGDTATVCKGWAEVEGWSISPSAVGEFLTRLPGFRVEGPTVQVLINEFTEAVRKLVARGLYKISKP